MHSTIVALTFGLAALVIGGCASDEPDLSTTTASAASDSCVPKPPTDDGDWDRWRTELDACIAKKTGEAHGSSSGSSKGAKGFDEDFEDDCEEVFESPPEGEARIEPPSCKTKKSGSAKAGKDGKSSSSATPGCSISIRCVDNAPCVCSRPNMSDVECSGNASAADACAKICTCN